MSRNIGVFVDSVTGYVLTSSYLQTTELQTTSNEIGDRDEPNSGTDIDFLLKWEDPRDQNKIDKNTTQICIRDEIRSSVRETTM